MLYLAPLGQDILYSKEKNEIGRNFANKVWNAGRFLLINRDQIGEAPKSSDFNLDHLDLADRWILSRFSSSARDLLTALEQYEINKVSKCIYDFFWHDYCDWYVEMIKSRLYGDEAVEAKRAVVSRALDVYDAALRLLHPLMPFVTEELWQNIRKRKPSETIMCSRLIQHDEKLIDIQVEEEMLFVQNVIESLRNIRGEMGISPAKEISVVMRLTDARTTMSVERYGGYMKRLARVSSLTVSHGGTRPRLSASAVVQGEEIFVPLEGLINVEIERTRLQKEIDRIIGILADIRHKLENESFVSKAPKDVVEREREKQSNFETNLEKLQRSLRQLTD
jgi:valyl-tRNA synthetase